jgi:Fe-S-cluster containining protein
VNPYEVARLAQNQAITTTEFLARYTDAGGTALKQTDSGACIFLTAQGCGVHPDRPLVCRLYPLGRRVTAEGEETFHELTPHPRTEGEYGTNGTVDAFLLQQGADPFIEAADRYVDVVRKIAQALEERPSSGRDLQDEINPILEEITSGRDQSASDLLDVDQVLERYCAERGMALPDDVDGRMVLHIEAIRECLRQSVTLAKTDGDEE